MLLELYVFFFFFFFDTPKKANVKDVRQVRTDDFIEGIKRVL